MYDRSGEPVVHSNELGLPRIEVSGSEFVVGSPTSEEEVARKKSQTKRAPKIPLTAVLESWLRFLRISWLIFRLCASDAETILGISGNEDVSTGVETDGQLKGRHIIVTRSLVPLAVPQHDVPEAFLSRCRSRQLLEQAFDAGNICVKVMKLLVLFLVDSKFLPHLCHLDQFVTNPAATVIRVAGHQMVSLCRSVCEEEKAQLLSPLMNS